MGAKFSAWKTAHPVWFIILFVIVPIIGLMVLAVVFFVSLFLVTKSKREKKEAKILQTTEEEREARTLYYQVRGVDRNLSQIYKVVLNVIPSFIPIRIKPFKTPGHPLYDRELVINARITEIAPDNTIDKPMIYDHSQLIQRITIIEGGRPPATDYIPIDSSNRVGIPILTLSGRTVIKAIPEQTEFDITRPQVVPSPQPRQRRRVRPRPQIVEATVLPTQPIPDLPAPVELPPQIPELPGLQRLEEDPIRTNISALLAEAAAAEDIAEDAETIRLMKQAQRMIDKAEKKRLATQKKADAARKKAAATLKKAEAADRRALAKTEAARKKAERKAATAKRKARLVLETGATELQKRRQILKVQGSHQRQLRRIKFLQKRGYDNVITIISTNIKRMRRMHPGTNKIVFATKTGRTKDKIEGIEADGVIAYLKRYVLTVIPSDIEGLPQNIIVSKRTNDDVLVTVLIGGAPRGR